MRAMPVVWTEDPGGGGTRVFLNRLGGPSAVTGLRWSTTYPGGDSEWSCDLSFDPTRDHLGLKLGRKLVIAKGGATRFQGSLDQAERGQPWQLSGQGLAVIGGAFTAVDSSGNANTLNNIVDQAITRGLPWTRPSSLTSAGTAASGSKTIAQSLADVGKALGTVWSLSARGALTMAAPPTAPSYILQTAQPLNPVVTGLTQAVGQYQSTSTATATKTASDSDAQDEYGKREGRYDMTGLGVITATNATTYLTNWLDANIAHKTYTDPITVAAGQLRAYTPSDGTRPAGMGGPVDLATVRAGCLVAVLDATAGHTAAGQLQILVGRTDYDADTDTLQLTPVGAKGQNLLAVLYGGDR